MKNRLHVSPRRVAFILVLCPFARGQSSCRKFRTASLWRGMIAGILLFSLLPLANLLAAVVESQSNQVILENDYYRYVFDTSQGLKLKELHNRFTADNNIKDQTNLHLGVIDCGEHRVTLDTMKVARVSQEGKGRINFDLENPLVNCRLRLHFDDSPETQWTLEVRNAHDREISVKVIFPLLSGIIPGPSLEHTWFHHGLNGQMIGRQPVHLCGMSGYSFPIMDLFNKSLGGLFLISQDPDQSLKGYELIKKEPGKSPRVYGETSGEYVRSDRAFNYEQGGGMAVVQGVHQIAPHGKYLTPSVVLGVHAGRWEKAWESYRSWLRSISQPRSDQAVGWWREVYISKAIHQHHFWKDGRFDWSEAIRPFDRNSYFDINHWMNNRGDYIIREDQGGPSAWKKQLAQLRQRNIHSAFYIEACCLNPLSEVGQKHADWAVLSQGKRAQENGEGNPPRPESREYNMCPGSPWKGYVAATAARILKETEVDAIYLDSMALRYWSCEDTHHAHQSGEGWHRNAGEALRLVNQKVDQVKRGIPIYCEFYSSDINAQYMDGSYSPCLIAAQGITQQGFDFCRPGTCLFRFYFPKFKMMEICDANEKNLSMALFNGNGIHEFFDKPAIWPFITECARIWEQNLDAFISLQPDALLETGHEDIFMNRFPDGVKVIYTFWNGAGSLAQPAISTLKTNPSRHFVELFSHQACSWQDGRLLVAIPAERVAVVAELPQLLKVKKNLQGEIIVSYDIDLKDPSLIVYARSKDRWLEKSIRLAGPVLPSDPAPNPGFSRIGNRAFQLSPSSWFDHQGIEAISVALLDGKKLVDEQPVY